MVRFSTGPISTPTFSASCISTSVDKTWVWTVPSSSTAAMVQHFYQQNLMNGAWSFTHVRKVCQGEGNYLFVSSCEKAGMKQILFVAIGSKLSVENSQGQTTSSITASAGESLLAIALAPAGQDQTVLGSTIPGNTSLFCN